LAAIRCDLQRVLGVVDQAREDDDAPGCLPGLRPELVRDERCLAGFFESSTSPRQPGAPAPRSDPSTPRTCASTHRCPPAARRSPQPAARRTGRRARRHPAPPRNKINSTRRSESHRPHQQQRCQLNSYRRGTGCSRATRRAAAESG
jgi:hypothetical protein